ncbi:uncharacterized protein [Argopecten irradians]|uniref:uncharacterized protein isoform X4 n=1 Tax=Argopecten irradians TaxID=31199 RepID=UPI003715B43E
MDLQGYRGELETSRPRVSMRLFRHQQHKRYGQKDNESLNSSRETLQSDKSISQQNHEKFTEFKNRNLKNAVKTPSHERLVSQYLVFIEHKSSHSSKIDRSDSDRNNDANLPKKETDKKMKISSKNVQGHGSVNQNCFDFAFKRENKTKRFLGKLLKYSCTSQNHKDINSKTTKQGLTKSKGKKKNKCPEGQEKYDSDLGGFDLRREPEGQDLWSVVSPESYGSDHSSLGEKVGGQTEKSPQEHNSYCSDKIDLVKVRKDQMAKVNHPDCVIKRKSDNIQNNRNISHLEMSSDWHLNSNTIQDIRNHHDAESKVRYRTEKCEDGNFNPYVERRLYRDTCPLRGSPSDSYNDNKEGSVSVGERIWRNDDCHVYRDEKHENSNIYKCIRPVDNTGNEAMYRKSQRVTSIGNKVASPMVQRRRALLCATDNIHRSSLVRPVVVCNSKYDTPSTPQIHTKSGDLCQRVNDDNTDYYTHTNTGCGSQASDTISHGNSKAITIRDGPDRSKTRMTWRNDTSYNDRKFGWNSNKGKYSTNNEAWYGVKPEIGNTNSEHRYQRLSSFYQTNSSIDSGYDTSCQLRCSEELVDENVFQWTDSCSPNPSISCDLHSRQRHTSTESECFSDQETFKESFSSCTPEKIVFPVDSSCQSTLCFHQQASQSTPHHQQEFHTQQYQELYTQQYQEPSPETELIPPLVCIHCPENVCHRHIHGHSGMSLHHLREPEDEKINFQQNISKCHHQNRVPSNDSQAKVIYSDSPNSGHHRLVGLSTTCKGQRPMSSHVNRSGEYLGNSYWNKTDCLLVNANAATLPRKQNFVRKPSQNIHDNYKVLKSPTKQQFYGNTLEYRSCTPKSPPLQSPVCSKCGRSFQSLGEDSLGSMSKVQLHQSPQHANLQRTNRLNAGESKYQSQVSGSGHKASSKHKAGVIHQEGGKLVATVAPTTLPHLSHQKDHHHSHHKHGHHENDSNTLPQLNKSQPESVTRQNSFSTTATPDRTKRDQYGNKLPMSPSEALKLYRNKLTAFEQTEILDYPEIWFLGLEAKKIEGVPGGAQNNGYDDENGSYIKVMHDHMVYRYEILEVLGKGSFGQVVKCYDHKTDQMVAIKIIRNKKRFHHQALVEVKILDALRRKDKDNQFNIIHMGEYFCFRNHLCITFELMGMNLYELIKKNNFQGFSIALIRRFAFSLLQCLKLLQRDRIIHCDLKPENILLRQRGQSSIKVIDFGSSCYEHQRVYTYIQSRFYRSPEVILGYPYSMPIDMWSFGCILAELYTGYPLFPGENEVEQLACIMEVLGLPPSQVLDQATRRRLFFDSKCNPRCITNSKGKKRRVGSKDLQQAVKTSDANFLDFIRRCLEWDPSIRLTPEEALQHEWIKEGLVHRRGRESNRNQKSTHRTSPAVSESTNASEAYKPDPYKVPAQPPVKERQKSGENWKVNLKERKSAKVRERVPPVGASAEQKHDEVARGKKL